MQEWALLVLLRDTRDKEKKVGEKSFTVTLITNSNGPMTDPESEELPQISSKKTEKKSFRENSTSSHQISKCGNQNITQIFFTLRINILTALL